MFTSRKQLAWSELSIQPRFVKFREKVVHLVLDDAGEAPIEMLNDSRWKLGGPHEEVRWKKIKEWNSITHSLTDNDIMGFGDADEVTSRTNIQLLKYCPLKSKSLDIGIWFPFGRMDQTYMSDYPVSFKYKYTLG